MNFKTFYMATVLLSCIDVVEASCLQDQLAWICGSSRQKFVKLTESHDEPEQSLPKDLRALLEIRKQEKNKICALAIYNSWNRLHEKTDISAQEFQDMYCTLRQATTFVNTDGKCVYIYSILGKQLNEINRLYKREEVCYFCCCCPCYTWFKTPTTHEISEWKDNLEKALFEVLIQDQSAISQYISSNDDTINRLPLARAVIIENGSN